VPTVIKKIEDQKEWDRFVNDKASPSIFHLWKFLKIIEKHTKYELLPYGIYKGDELLSIIPLFYKEILSVKVLFSPPPLTAIPYMGLLIDKDFINFKQSKKDRYIYTISEELCNKIEEIKPDYCSICLFPNLTDIRYFKNKNYFVDTNYTYITKLNEDLNDIWSKIDKGVRNKINTQEKIDIEEIQDASIVYKSIEQRYKDQKINLPIICEDYLSDLKKEFPDNVKIRIAKNNGEIIGSEIVLCYRNVVWDWLGGSKPQTKIPVNEILKWNMIEDYKKKNFNELDYVGANNEKISTFKVKFEPELQSYFRERFGKLFTE